ncbi:unnamed protein product [Porites lobata]|uniref:Uncharacterized protein n=1 Tax=Porites lobata TaxID=104759 RepID=A0ABN8QDW4_9CNID|nr:unnamed protein product [Porites lobata]
MVAEMVSYAQREKAVANTHREMNRAFGQRLSEMMMTESPLRDQQDNSKQRVSVEEIVYNEKFVYMNRLSEARIETEKLLHSSDLSKVQKSRIWRGKSQIC